MKKLLNLAVACYLFLLGVAATYYVEPSGSDVLNSGTAAATPFRTIERVNAVAAPGDIIYCYPGAYTAPPFPSAGGSNTTTGMIRYIGVGGTSDTLVAQTIRFPGGDCTKSYVSWNGITFTTGLGFTNALFDSVKNCRLDSGPQLAASHYNIFHEVIGTGSWSAP
jgi:hypothetical protein